MITADMATTATSITPRSYQHEAVEAVLEAHGQGMRRPLVALPTGTGKTIVFALLAQQRGGRTLVLAHRDELIQQAVDKLQLVMPDLDIGLVKAEHNDTDAECVVASVQTLARARGTGVLRARLSRIDSKRIIMGKYKDLQGSRIGFLRRPGCQRRSKRLAGLRIILSWFPPRHV